ncbi:GntR family transcriptional regulator [Pigmentiphaga kullae]|uniref:GntR family transcriptional regulator n=1 Tax=Pigmentiphaga kullae TaxID=151784 RepID=A0A4Q7NEB0_9BURK|nr:GntR family transcriptional regulator [Pigmentiphaga kullae]RZS81345.1 GntR family transcriptional regulator [Pigmentiphaga kullae]
MPRPSKTSRPAASRDGDEHAGGSLSLGEQAYVAVKRMILSHELRPGEHINVGQLCQRLDLGRSPIHLATHRLAREGLVEILPRKGLLVKAETLDGFLELIAARQLIEPFLTGLAVDHMRPEIVQQLQELVDAGWERYRAKDHAGGMEIDRRFHHLLYETADNRTLSDFAALLLDRSMLLWFRPKVDAGERANVAELEDLLDCIRRGDRAGAVRTMEAHVGSIRQKYLG